jgi:hypothetical protein
MWLPTIAKNDNNPMLLKFVKNCVLMHTNSHPQFNVLNAQAPCTPFFFSQYCMFQEFVASCNLPLQEFEHINVTSNSKNLHNITIVVIGFFLQQIHNGLTQQ